MTASQGTPAARRTILRFDLSSISLDGRPNAYKKPQLVLKPQLDLPPRRPYTGSKPRVPVWRHFLMVHVKDKAAELVKLDLASFKQVESSADFDPVPCHSVSYLFSTCSLIFRYPREASQETSTLGITFQKTSDIEKILQELNSLDIVTQDEQANFDHRIIPQHAPLEPWKPHSQTMQPPLRPPSALRLLNSSSPPLTTPPSSQQQYLPYPESQPHGAVFQRPPSQPTGQPPYLPADHRPWSPAFVPSRPATTLGVPGILGEGIYKVSKVGATASSRPRVRRTATILEQQVPKFYTVSKHFDKTLGILSSRAPYAGTALPAAPQSDSPAYLARPPSANPGDQGMRPPSRTSSALGGLPVNIQHRAPLRRLRTIEDSLGRPLTPAYEDRENQFFLSSVAEEKPGFYSQPGLAARSPALTDYECLSSSETFVQPPARREVDDDWLLRFSQIQHEGLCEASRVWDEFMEKGAVDVASAEDARYLKDMLSRFESEFTRRWEVVVAAAAQKMREVQLRGYAY